ncbi:MAG: sigma-54-dependent Fis family transcriptional regulator, partial [PS1 clade bacterium]
MAKKKNILIIDDEIDICKLISGVLEDEGYTTNNAQNSDNAISLLSNKHIDLVILDVWLEGSKLDGIELLYYIQKENSSVPVIIISGHGNIDTAVMAIRIGAYDYLEKPFKTERLMHTINRAIETYSLKQEITEIKNKSNYANEYIGISPAVINLNQTILKLSETKSRILITGSIGVGKELVSRLIHNSSPRSNFLFTRINANGLKLDNFEQMLNSESDANDNNNLIKQINGGTLFVNEITEMNIDVQRVFLNFINNKYANKSDDLRIIVSTSKDLKSYVSLGLFLEELYNRVSVEPIHVPSLIDRKEDIPILVKYFIEDYYRAIGEESNVIIDNDALILLQSYSWPGNIKELRNIIEKLILQMSSDNVNTITADLIPIEIKENHPNIINDNEVLISFNMKDARDIF